jgi:hypothetical protein
MIKALIKFKRTEMSMKKLAIILLVLLATTQVATAIEFTGSYADAKAQAASQNRPLLLEFSAEW